ncbi:hypothetical protein [Streptomyces sp. NPDC050504]|uniref:hypothetical protein n=1 Tax=Streptomyces sp. NPDC050504 TaxID=3365618 RepID=UPI00379ED16D
MSDQHSPQDPLNALFKDAATGGGSRSRPVPVTVIAQRGRRAHRRRIVALAAGTCLFLAGAGAVTGALLPGGGGTTLPADSPSPSPAPSPPPSPSPGATEGSPGPDVSQMPTHPPDGSPSGVPSSTSSHGRSEPDPTPSNTPTGTPSRSMPPPDGRTAPPS